MNIRMKKSYNYFSNFFLKSQIFWKKNESCPKKHIIQKKSLSIIYFSYIKRKKYFISPMHKTLYVYRNF